MIGRRGQEAWARATAFRPLPKTGAAAPRELAEKGHGGGEAGLPGCRSFALCKALHHPLGHMGGGDRLVRLRNLTPDFDRADEKRHAIGWQSRPSREGGEGPCASFGKDRAHPRLADPGKPSHGMGKDVELTIADEAQEQRDGELARLQKMLDERRILLRPGRTGEDRRRPLAGLRGQPPGLMATEAMDHEAAGLQRFARCKNERLPRGNGEISPG